MTRVTFTSCEPEGNRYELRSAQEYSVAAPLTLYWPVGAAVCVGVGLGAAELVAGDGVVGCVVGRRVGEVEGRRLVPVAAGDSWVAIPGDVASATVVGLVEDDVEEWPERVRPARSHRRRSG